MIRHRLLASDLTSRKSSRRRNQGRRSVLEALEGRVLLATIYTVDQVGDAGNSSGPTSGDIRFVIGQVNANPDPAGNIIRFQPDVFASRQTIPLSSTLELSEKLGPEEIDGPAAGVAFDGSSGTRSGDILVDQGVTATLSRLWLENGQNTADGGGIANSGNLTVVNCDIGGLAGNTAQNDGGGIANFGTMTITNSSILNGSATRGSGISNTGTLTIADCTIKGNTASGVGGGLLNQSGTATVTRCLVQNNTAGNDGGGIENLNNTSRMFLSDSTIAGNSAQSGGGIMNDGATLITVNDTIAFNQASVGAAGDGGGLSNSGGDATLDNTIVAENLNGPTTPSDIPLAVSRSSAFNLIGTGGSGGLANGVNGNQVGVANPGLDDIRDNGGTSPTVALLPGSPAIDAGSNGAAVEPLSNQPLATDQRGAGFARISNGTVDIGAFEVQVAGSPTPTPTPSPTPTPTPSPTPTPTPSPTPTPTPPSSPCNVTGAWCDWGSHGSSPLQCPDGVRLLPAGRNTDVCWLGIYQIRVAFDRPVTLTPDEVSVQCISGTDYGPVTITGSGTTYDITLARPIQVADRVVLSINGPGINSYTRQLNVLPGDVNDDGKVNGKDVAALRSAQKGKGGAGASIFDDILGNGGVTAQDVKATRKFHGQRLPTSSGSGHKGHGAQAVAAQPAGASPMLDRAWWGWLGVVPEATTKRAK